MKCQHAIAEMPERGRNAAIVRGNRHRVQRTAAVPDCGEARGAENFPAMGVGDAQRQTAVGETLIDVVHPFAVGRRGTNVDGVAVDDISAELHGAFHRIAATRKALDCGDPLTRNPTTSIAGCGAHTASGHVAVAPLRSVMNSRRLIVSPEAQDKTCLLYTSPSPRDRTRSRMPS